MMPKRVAPSRFIILQSSVQKRSSTIAQSMPLHMSNDDTMRYLMAMKPPRKVRCGHTNAIIFIHSLMPRMTPIEYASGNGVKATQRHARAMKAQKPAMPKVRRHFHESAYCPGAQRQEDARAAMATSMMATRAKHDTELKSHESRCYSPPHATRHAVKVAY